MIDDKDRHDDEWGPPILNGDGKTYTPGVQHPKERFLHCFGIKKTVAGAVALSGVSKTDYNAWMRDDAEFHRKFMDLEDAIDDQALTIAYKETGILKRVGGDRKLKIDRPLLREILKRHPRFKPPEEKKVSTEARPIEIRGIDPKILLRVTGTGFDIGIAESEAEAKRLSENERVRVSMAKMRAKRNAEAKPAGELPDPAAEIPIQPPEIQPEPPLPQA